MLKSHEVTSRMKAGLQSLTRSDAKEFSIVDFRAVHLEASTVKDRLKSYGIKPSRRENWQNGYRWFYRVEDLRRALEQEVAS